jgi:hypothetical protein
MVDDENIHSIRERAIPASASSFPLGSLRLGTPPEHRQRPVPQGDFFSKSRVYCLAIFCFDAVNYTCLYPRLRAVRQSSRLLNSMH